MKRSIAILSLVALGVGPVLAKCHPGGYGLVVHRADETQYTPQSTVPVDEQVDPYDFRTIYLGPGDTLVVTRYPGGCNSFGDLAFEGVHIWDNPAKITAAGSYYGLSCDDGCFSIAFVIAPLTTAPVPIPISARSFLGGAVEQGQYFTTMRTDLHDQGLVPMVEPYTALGYTHVGGGGEVMGPDALGAAVVDWVVLELRDAASPEVVVATRSCLVLDWGLVVDAEDLDLYPKLVVPAGSYYLAVRHRNHLGEMTPLPMMLGFGGVHYVQFQTWLWPGNAHATPGIQSVRYAGAGNDRDAILLAIGGAVPTNTATGYLQEDVNLDSVVKYAGTDNDRDVVLQTIGGAQPTAVRTEQLP